MSSFSRIFFSKKLEQDGPRYRLLFIRVKIAKLLRRLTPLLRLLDHLIPKDDRLVGFFSYPDFGDNPKVYSDWLAEHHPEYRQYWFYRNAFSTPQEQKVVPGEKFLWYSLSSTWRMFRCRYIVSSHATPDYLSSPRHISINLWHGMPIKTLGFTEPHMNETGRQLFERLSRQSHFFVTSDLFKSIMGVCFAAKFSRIHITGQPRTDAAFGSAGNFLGDFSRVICYTPTFKEKQMYGKRNISTEFRNCFYLEDYDEQDFIRMLEENNWLLLFKPHPYDEWFYRRYYAEHPITSKHFRVLYDADLKAENLYFYQLFSGMDVIISDFSSIVLDFMVTRKPVIFLNALNEDYSQNRGFILEDNFELMMPGEKVATYAALKAAIADALTVDSWKERRLSALPLIHKYPDGKACERVYEVMQALGEGRAEA